jgi:hypothetical protein
MTDQNAQSSGASTTAAPATDQNAQGATSTATGSNAADQNAASADQNAANAKSANQGQGNANGLPQTASPLPLLGLLGLGSFFTGLIARFRK